MILVAAWHGLSATEVVSFTRDAVKNGNLTILRIKGVRTTTQPLVKHTDPLLDEEKGLSDFMQHVPPGEPVFNIGRQQFNKLVHKYGELAQIPRDKATARALKHSIAIQNLVPGANSTDLLAEAHRTVVELREEVRKNALAASDLSRRLKEAEAVAAGLKRKKKADEDKRSAGIRSKVEAEIAIFSKLFSLPDIQKHPNRLLDRKWSQAEFSEEHITAAVNALRAHAPCSRRPMIAARWFVAASEGLEYDTVARYDRKGG